MSRRSLSVSAGAESPPPCLFKPFVIGEPPALLHAATDARAFDLLDLEHDEAVVEQQRVARDDIVGEISIRAPDGMLVAGIRVHRHVERELVAFDEHHGPGLERLDADLRALEVAHDADMAADLLGHLAARARRAPLDRRPCRARS